MRVTVFLVFCLLFFSGCSPTAVEDMMEDIILDVDIIDKPEGEVEVYSKGKFVSDEHKTSGTCTVSLDKSKLSFVNFSTDNGPKLLVYLSDEVGSDDFVDLGALQGIKGDFVYNIPEDTDLSKHKYVVIWCVDFLVSFGHAELK